MVRTRCRLKFVLELICCRRRICLSLYILRETYLTANKGTSRHIRWQYEVREVGAHWRHLLCMYWCELGLYLAFDHVNAIYQFDICIYLNCVFPYFLKKVRKDSIEIYMNRGIVKSRTRTLFPIIQIFMPLLSSSIT